MNVYKLCGIWEATNEKVPARGVCRHSYPSPAFLQSICDGDHDDDDLCEASWDPHHMPLPIPAKKRKLHGTHPKKILKKNVGDHAFCGWGPHLCPYTP